MVSGPVGSYVIAAPYSTVLWAVEELERVLSGAQIKKLKVRSGEHIAAIVTTTFLGAAPTKVDTDGDGDLHFEFADEGFSSPLWSAPVRVADFEVKSLPGPYRKFDHEIDRAEAEGREPDRTLAVPVTSANDVLRSTGREAIRRAKSQLDKKSGPGNSKNIFLVAHLFDYLPIEWVNNVLMAHTLEPLSALVGPDAEGVDTVWVLWASDTIVVWSSARQEWVNLLVAQSSSEDMRPSEGLDFLQSAEKEYLSRINHSGGSPFLFTLDAEVDKDLSE